MPVKNLNGHETAKRLFTTTAMSPGEIAREAGCHVNTVYCWARQGGWVRPKGVKMPRRRRRSMQPDPDNLKEIRRLYEETRVLTDVIASRFGMTGARLAVLAQQHGWDRENPRKYRHPRMAADDGIGVRVRKCQFPLWDQELPPLSEIDDHFCGKPVKEGSNYCKKHHEICREKPDPTVPRVRWNYTGKLLHDE
ncbi:MAG: hypothetical protein WD185_09300 [Sneathiella sp.]